MSTRVIFALALSLAACQPSGPSRYDEAASRAYRAAWDLHRGGDDAGYKRALEALAKQRGTWAGDRAAIDLERLDDKNGSSLLRKLVEQATQIMSGSKGANPPAVSPSDSDAAP